MAVCEWVDIRDAYLCRRGDFSAMMEATEGDGGVSSIAEAIEEDGSFSAMIDVVEGDGGVSSIAEAIEGDGGVSSMIEVNEK